MARFAMGKILVLAVALILVISGFAAGALAENAILPIFAQGGDGAGGEPETQAPAGEKGEDTDQPPLEREFFWVEFFDINGESLGYVWVHAGDWLLAPEWVPEEEGQRFEYWYDYELYLAKPHLAPEAYEFGAPIEKDIFLCPYYTQIAAQAAPGEQPEAAVGEAQSDLVSQIMAQFTAGGPSGEEGEEDGQAAADLVEQIMATASPGSGEPEVESLVGGFLQQLVVHAGGDNAQSDMTEEQAKALIESITASVLGLANAPGSGEAAGEEPSGEEAGELAGENGDGAKESVKGPEGEAAPDQRDSEGRPDTENIDETEDIEETEKTEGTEAIPFMHHKPEALPDGFVALETESGAALYAYMIRCTRNGRPRPSL